jgi:hypothetical protein
VKADKFVDEVRWAAERVRQQSADEEPFVVVGRCANGDDVPVRSVTYVGNVVRIVVDR